MAEPCFQHGVRGGRGWYVSGGSRCLVRARATLPLPARGERVMAAPCFQHGVRGGCK